MPQLHVIKPGLLSLVQDQGRKGYQAFGVPVGGAMDRFSARLANALVGNSPNQPVLEITLMGPEIQWEAACQIALTGADLSAEMDAVPLPLNETIDVKSGAVLRFGRCRFGCRAYLAIGGDLDVPDWLGSSSAAHPNARQVTPQSILQKGQRLSFTPSPFITNKRIPNEVLLYKEHTPLIRVLPGPEYEQVDPLSIGYFFSEPYKISPDSNRMGYRLQGKALKLVNTTPNISSAVMPGTIQVTREGHPILLMADAQTTGGYTRFLQVIEVDRDRLGQAKPGDEIRFSLISREEALTHWKEKIEWEKKLREKLRNT